MSIHGILDFTYAPYALGDALTFVSNLQSLCLMYGFEDAELIVLTLPDNPSGPLQNRKIDATNYHHSITGLYPAFLLRRS